MSDTPPDIRVYKVTCKDCDLEEIFRDDEPPSHVVNYYNSKERARRNWSAKSAAKGERDGHSASCFRDYENGLRHRPSMERLDTDNSEALDQ